MPKKGGKRAKKRERPMLLLTDLDSVEVRDGVIIVRGKAGDYMTIVAVTPGYARALSIAFAKCLAEIDGANVVTMRAPKH